ncbi:H-NS family nucleoid-associated regulatory protein [Herbaspirillum sp. SJZ107]|uniref:H-NS histone family protein n=1 Tax=Herbaspirillum sp. SJZ107 TaxID=2572881 RepID=UPI0011508AAF|nr:H-NS histone family protein [Herbaspirillum sp. SJZ107]TQK01265.1 DNA-binding protein H-NS [Herbaspirillum sp. SJZ107]
MAQVDLSAYDLAGLKALQAEIEKQIKDRQQQEVKKAREQILAIAQDVGVPVEELFSNSGAKSKGNTGKKAQPQYQNPADSSQTWTGRGRQPRWIADGLANGKILDEYRI